MHDFFLNSKFETTEPVSGRWIGRVRVKMPTDSGNGFITWYAEGIYRKIQ